MNRELERKWKEGAMVQLISLSRQLSGAPERTQEKVNLEIAGLRV
jgi:hypothetical protein